MQSSFPYIFSHSTVYARLLSIFYVLLFICLFLKPYMELFQVEILRHQALGCMDVTFHSLLWCWLPLLPNAQPTGWNHFLFANSGDSSFQGFVSSLVCSEEKLCFAVYWLQCRCMQPFYKSWRPSPLWLWQIVSGFCHLAEMGHFGCDTWTITNHHGPIAMSNMQWLCFLWCLAFRLCIGCRCLVGLFCLCFSPS